MAKQSRYWVVLFGLFYSISSYAVNDTLAITNEKTILNLAAVASVFTSTDSIVISELKPEDFVSPIDSKNYFYFDFNLNTIVLKVNLKNTTAEQKQLLLRFSNAMIYEIIGYEQIENRVEEIYFGGIKYPFNTRLNENRNHVIPLTLEANERSTFIIRLNKMKGRPLVSHATIFDDSTLNDVSFKEYIVIGIYVGLSLICVIIGISFFLFLKDNLYLFYSLYVAFLGLFLLSYCGVFQQVFLEENVILNKYNHYVIFSEISLVLFVLFSQKFLGSKKIQPKLYKVLILVVCVAVILRLLLHFFMSELFLKYIPIFMKVWYLLNFIGIGLIAYQIIAVYRKSNNKNMLFSIAYLLMIGGSLISILYHSYGVIDAMLFNLPILMYTSFLEIILITVALAFVVKNIFREKNQLLEKIEQQRLQNLATFIRLTNKEKIYLDQLKYIKSDGNYLEFYLDERRVINRNRLKMILEELPTNFVQVHRSYIVNKNYIKSTSSTSVVLNPDTEIPISRKFKNNL